MDISTLTIGQAREIAALFGKQTNDNPGPWQIGGKYFIRTVTYHLTGKLESVGSQELVLSDAAWIADSGRFSQAVASGEMEEVEPFPDGKQVIVGRSAIVDAVLVDKLNRSQK